MCIRDRLTAGAVGMVAFGAAVLIAGAGMALMSQACVNLVSAGTPAIAVMAGMVVALAGLMALAAVLGLSLIHIYGQCNRRYPADVLREILSRIPGWRICRYNLGGIIGSDILTIPSQGQTLYGKRISSLIGGDVKVYEDGTVTGTMKHVTGYTGFNEADPEEQEGYFFPFHLTKSGTNMTFKKNGAASKENIPWEADNVFRVTSSDRCV